MADQDEALQTDVAEEEDALESWEEGSAFGVSDDKDPVCETPVEDWVKEPKNRVN